MSEPLTNEQMDDLVTTADVPGNQEMAMEAPAPVAEQTPESNTFKFKADGKDIEADQDLVIKYAQQGYNYAQRMQSFNQDKQRLLDDQKKFNDENAVYKNFDNFAKQHPDWWQQQLSTLQKGEIPVQASSEGKVDEQKEMSPEVQALQAELSEYKSKVDSILADKEMSVRQSEDQALETEMKSIREEYKDLDWQGLDANGKTLEYQVLDHAQKTGINNFRAAFRDFNHEKLIALAQDKGKDSLSRDLQMRTKLGILGETPEPLKKVQTPLDPKNFTYDDLESQVVNELGLKEEGDDNGFNI